MWVGADVGVNRLFKAKCDVRHAKTRMNFSSHHACGCGGFGDSGYTRSWLLSTHADRAEERSWSDACTQCSKQWSQTQLGLIVKRGADISVTPKDAFTTRNISFTAPPPTCGECWIAC